MSTCTVRPVGVVRRDERGRDEPARLEHEQIAGRIGLDRGHLAPSSVPAASRTVAPTSSWTQRVPGTSTGSASSSTPRSALGRRTALDTVELHDVAVLAERLGGGDGQDATGPTPASSPGRAATAGRSRAGRRPRPAGHGPW